MPIGAASFPSHSKPLRDRPCILFYILYCAGPLVGSIDSRETHHGKPLSGSNTHTQTHLYTQARASLTHCQVITPPSPIFLHVLIIPTTYLISFRQNILFYTN